MMRNLVLSGPAALTIRLYPRVRFGRPRRAARRRAGRWRVAAWSMVVTVILGGMV